MTFLRRERRPEGKFNCFWRALTSTNQFESPCFSIVNSTDETVVTSTKKKNNQLPADVGVSKTSVLEDDAVGEWPRERARLQIERSGFKL